MASANTLTRLEAIERASLISDVSYDMELVFDDDERTFGSTALVRFRAARPGASTFIELTAPTLTSAVLNGRTLPADAFDGNRIVLDDLAAENELRVVSRCAYTTTGQGMHRMVDPTDDLVYARTQFEPYDAHQVYACFDQPDLKATFTLKATAPTDWIVIGNTPATRPAPGQWEFETTPLISTYLSVCIAGPYHQVTGVHGDLPMGLSCRQSMKEYLDADHLFDLTRKGLDYFAELFDSPYPFKKYDQAFVPAMGGAMENVACVTFDDAYLFRSKLTEQLIEARADTLYHEMAHMWFGDLVTMRWWDDLWLKESFATYMSQRALDEAGGFDKAWLHFSNSTKAAAYQADVLPTTHPISADIPDTDALRVNYDAITYNKGACVLAQLGEWVGREGFTQGAREYFKRHSWGNAELGDLLSALEEASGRSMKSWSAAWLETAGVNTLTPEPSIKDGKYESFAILQTAPVGDDVLRPHRLAVGLYTRRGDRLERTDRFELDVEGPRTEVTPLVGKKVPDLVLLNDGDLAYARVAIDEPSMATMRESLSSIDDPLARVLCWNAAWDMVREGVLPSRRFLDLVVRHAGTEEDVETLQKLLGQGSSAATYYGAPANSDAARRKLADAVAPLLDAAEPGSDRQLTVARSWVSTSRDAGAIRALLEGTAPREGLVIDIDFRTTLLANLALLDALTDADIDAMGEIDPTDQGRRRAVLLRGMRPRAEAKAEAWGQAVNNRELDLQTRSMAAASIFQRDQDDLVFPYLAKYEETLPGLWAEEELIIALRLTGGLFPDSLIQPEAVDTVSRLLEKELPVPARKILLDGRDQLQRCLRAREVDARDFAFGSGASSAS